jgi:NADPH2:quinone reductase
VNAIVIEQVGGPESLKLKDVPKPAPRSGEALIKIGAAGVNYIDTYFRSGMYKKDVPFTAGQEGAGTIEAAGDGTDLAKEGMKLGDRVVFTFPAGTYAEYAVVPVDKLIPIPEGVSFADACVAMIQGMTAHYLSVDTYPIKQGDTVLVHAAAGGVGQLLVPSSLAVTAPTRQSIIRSKISKPKSSASPTTRAFRWSMTAWERRRSRRA